MVLITIVTGVYKPTNITGGVPHCGHGENHGKITAGDADG